MRTALFVALVLAFLDTVTFAQEKTKSKDAWPPAIDGERHVYKTVGDRELSLWKVRPEPASGGKQDDARPAVVFFFGGGWTSGAPEQFIPQARHLSNRGMVAIVADYRVASRDGVKPTACVEDAKSAIRWVRQNSSKLGVDPNRICAAGGSAGGHIACCTALLDQFDLESEDQSISSVPNAMALFNPAVVLAPLEGLPIDDDSKKKADALKQRLGIDPAMISPAHHVKAGLPPCVVFHGEADTTVRIQTVEKFASLMTDAGNRCELHRFPDAPHGFFNLRDDARGPAASSARGKGARFMADKSASNEKNAGSQSRNREWHEKSLKQLDDFFVSLAWLPSATR